MKEEKEERSLVEKLADGGISEDLVEGAVVIAGYDGCIVGVTTDGCLIYDYDLMTAQLVSDDGMTWADAEDFLDYNVLGSYASTGDRHPIIMHAYSGCSGRDYCDIRGLMV